MAVHAVQVNYDVVADKLTYTVHETDPILGDIMHPLPVGVDGYTSMEDALADVKSLVSPRARFCTASSAPQMSSPLLRGRPPVSKRRPLPSSPPQR